MTVDELLAEYGSPLWLADVDRFRENLREFTEAWCEVWPDVRVAYSYKTNRTRAFLEAAEREGAWAEVASETEYGLATALVEIDPARVVVDGPAKRDSLLVRAGAGDALVLVDSREELARAAAAGVSRVGLRVALDSFTGTPTRFGIPPAEIRAAARDARRYGIEVQALSTHLVSTDFDPATGRVVVSWPRPAAEHADAASILAALAADLALDGHEVRLLDLGGGFPHASVVDEHAHAVTAALRRGGFQRTLLLEPGRALVADAVDLAFTVVAVKTLRTGALCLVCDAGTNFLPGAAVSPPRLRAATGEGDLAPALVTGPLCLNVDVIHPRALLPEMTAGTALIAEGVGAYQQVAATTFGEAPPAVVVHEAGRWRVQEGGARSTERIMQAERGDR
jgi:diaminopimelate decarboxylase